MSVIERHRKGFSHILSLAVHRSYNSGLKQPESEPTRQTGHERGCLMDKDVVQALTEPRKKCQDVKDEEQEVERLH